MTTDRELLESYLKDRTETAFAALVERHVGLVYSAALRQVGGDAHLAQDVTQTVFIDLARRLERVSHPDSVAGWLYASTRFAAANTVRSERRRRDNEAKALLMKQHDADAADAAWQQIRPVLDDALTALPREDREAVILRFFESKSYGEIGAELQLREDTARARVERALEKLASRLRRHGVASTAEALGLALAAQGVGAAPAGLATTLAHTAFGAANQVAAVGAVKTLSLMTTTKLAGTTAICAVVLLLTIKVGQTRSDVASLRSELTRLETPPATRRVTPAPAPSASPTTTSGAAATPPPGALKYWSDDNALGEPEAAAVIARRQRRYAVANARSSIEGLHLSPEQAAQLKELLAAKWLARSDTSDVVQRLGDVPSSVKEKAIAAAEAEQEQKIQELLGPDRYSQFKSLYDERVAGSGNWILFTNFWDAGVPLTAEQKTALAHVMAQGWSLRQQGAEAPLPDPATGLKPADAEVLKAAAAFLSPEQLAFLRQQKLDDARYDQAVRNSVRRKATPKTQ